jgi:hypothetical protein
LDLLEGQQYAPRKRWRVHVGEKKRRPSESLNNVLMLRYASFAKRRETFMAAKTAAGRSAAAKKASKKTRVRATGKKVAKPRKARAAGKKAAVTRKRKAAARKAVATRQAKAAVPVTEATLPVLNAESNKSSGT